MQDKKFLGLLDMLDGGGAGRSGPEFQGGPLSGLLNALGIRPLGAGRAMDASPRPMPRPAGLGAPPPRPAPALTPPTVPPVETAALPPSMDEIMAALTRVPRGPEAFAGVRPPPAAPAAYPTLQELLRMQEAQRMREAILGANMGIRVSGWGR